MLVATAHGTDLGALLHNPELNPLVGGVQVGRTVSYFEGCFTMPMPYHALRRRVLQQECVRARRRLLNKVSTWFGNHHLTARQAQADLQ